MFKLIVTEGETKFGPDWTWIDIQSRHALDKVASVGVHVPESLAGKIKELQGNLPADKVAFYNRALGSYESFGLNRNGDGFARHELQANHDTFVKNAHYFKHHQNRDPALGRGRPVASAFNDATDMVDLVIVADMDKCAEQIHALEQGKRVPTSMGAKVAFDVCTICGHRARSRNEYCEHVKMAAADPFGMCRILPDGRVCGVMNPNPRFFDISDVIVGAAEESETLMKVASAHGVVSSAHLAELLLPKVAFEDKQSAHVKELPGEVTEVYRPLARGVRDLGEREREIPGHVIDRAVSQGGVEGLLRNSAALGIVLSPGEFSRATKTGSFNPPTVDEIHASDPLPKKAMSGSLSNEVMTTLSRVYDHRSSHQPALINRITEPAEKNASVNIGHEDERAKALYTAYRRTLIDVVDDVGGHEAVFWSMKCAGTSNRYLTDVSRAYVTNVFTSSSAPTLKEKILDRVEKVAQDSKNFTAFGRISATMADQLGVEALDFLAVESLRQQAF